MKYYLAAATLCLNLCAAEIEIGPPPRDIATELAELAAAMEGLSYSLRDDNYGGHVHIDGKQIEAELDRLIKEIEDTPAAKGKSSTRGRQAMVAQGNGPAQKSEPKPIWGSVIDRRTSSGAVRSENADWYKLPDAKRGEMVQTWASEMPLRWKNRIAAYFVSVACEDK